MNLSLKSKLEHINNIDNISKLVTPLISDIVNLIVKINTIHYGQYINPSSDDFIKSHTIIKNIGLYVEYGFSGLEFSLPLRKKKFGLFGENIYCNGYYFEDKNSHEINTSFIKSKVSNYSATVEEYKTLIDKLTNIKCNLEIELNTLRGDI